MHMPHFSTFSVLFDNLAMITPELVLGVAVLGVVFASVFFQTRLHSRCVGAIAFVGCAIALASAAEHFWLIPRTVHPFSSMLVMDRLAGFFRIFFLAGTIVTILASLAYRPLLAYRTGEYYALLLSCTLAMMLLGLSANWLMFYLALETLSLGSYVLSGYSKQDPRSVEAALKYFIYGTVASGITLFGISYLYGITGSLQIADTLSGGRSVLPTTIALLMVFVGLGFKISSVPFHFWAPDVYEGSPTPIAGYLAVASKAAGFAAILRVFLPLFDDLHMAVADLLQQINWRVIFWASSAITMTLGNLLALRQLNLKRMLAYSSIAHAGYLLMGLAVLDRFALEAVLFYLVAYLFMNLGAFVVLVYLENRIPSLSVQYYRGLIYRAPLQVVVLAILLFSLTGLPPTVGFVGKLLLFGGVIRSAIANPEYAVFYYVLAGIGAINTAISLYYYMYVLKVMVLRGSSWSTTPLPLESETMPPPDWRPTRTEAAFLIGLTIPTVWLGLFWEPLRAVIRMVLN